MTDAFPYTRATIMRLWWNLVALTLIGAGNAACWFAAKAESASERADYWHEVIKELRAND